MVTQKCPEARNGTVTLKITPDGIQQIIYVYSQKIVIHKVYAQAVKPSMDKHISVLSNQKP